MNKSNPHNFLIPLLIGAIIIGVTLSFVFIVNWMDKKADEQEGITFEQKLAEGAHGKVNLLDIIKMKPVYYMVVVNCFFGYGVISLIINYFNSIKKIFIKIQKIKII